jgi:hypothetical protein
MKEFTNDIEEFEMLLEELREYPESMKLLREKLIELWLEENRTVEENPHDSERIFISDERHKKEH